MKRRGKRGNLQEVKTPKASGQGGKGSFRSQGRRIRGRWERKATGGRGR
jgi:hypothetical protein